MSGGSGEEERHDRDEDQAITQLRNNLSTLEQVQKLLLDRRGAGSQDVLAAEGQYSSSPSVGRRVLLLTLQKGRLGQVGDLWLSPGDLAALIGGEKVSGLLPGWCDAMYSDRWNYAWTREPGRLRLWKRRGLILEASAEAVHITPGWLSPGRTLKSAALLRVRGWLSEDWVKRGVKLELRNGEAITVASRREAMALMDPTYDALDLLCDASWARDLARALGQTLGLPVEMDEDL